MSELPMFPLGSVLFPYLPLHLRVFEERYLVMLSRMLERDQAEFGVVLIERGQEVGGGEHRFGYGTVAQITELGAQEGYVVLVAQGERRFEVLEWDEELRGARQQAEQLVRRTLAQASEFNEQQWPAHVELSDDPVAAAWQLAGIAPLGPLDQVALLRSTSMAELLAGVVEATTAAGESFTAPWPEMD